MPTLAARIPGITPQHKDSTMPRPSRAQLPGLLRRREEFTATSLHAYYDGGTYVVAYLTTTLVEVNDGTHVLADRASLTFRAQSYFDLVLDALGITQPNH